MKLASSIAAVALWVACSSCGPRGGSASAKRNWPVVLITCDVPSATVWIDDRFVGQIDTLPAGVKIAPGKHRVEVRHDRYHTRYYELTLAAGERRTLEVSLPEALP